MSLLTCSLQYPFKLESGKHTVVAAADAHNLYLPSNVSTKVPNRQILLHVLEAESRNDIIIIIFLYNKEQCSQSMP